MLVVLYLDKNKIEVNVSDYTMGKALLIEYKDK